MRAAGYKLGGVPPARADMIGSRDPSGHSSHGKVNSWSPAGDDESLESLQQRTAAHENAIEASLARSLKTAQNSYDVGAETLKTLHQQKEQLKSIRTHQAQVEANLKTSEKLLRGMESWRGAAANWMAGMLAKDGGKSGTDTGNTALSKPKLGDSSKGTGDGGEKQQATEQHGSIRESAAVEIGQSDAMSQIAALVSGLRLQAETMNTELKAQSKELDSIHDKADSNANNLASINTRTKALRR